MTKINKAALTKLFTRSELFSGLSKDDLATLADSGEYLQFEKGSTVKSDSPFAGQVYIIHDGDVVVSRKDGANNEAVLARFLSGESFGELDLFSTHGNAVSIKAEAATTLLVFPGDGKDARGFFDEYPSLGSKVLRNLLSMVARRIRSTNHLLSQRSPWVQELRKQVFVDKLTGLYNKTWLFEEVGTELKTRSTGSAILIIKPDNFKVINDTYGHDAGDQTLSLLGSFVHDIARGSGLAARHGGDVFAIVHDNANSRKIATLAAKVVREAKKLDLTPIIGSSDMVLTVSVGVAQRTRGDNALVSETIQSAFDSMLVAREGGGDRVSGIGGQDE